MESELIVKTHFRTCNICDALCGLAIEYSDTQIVSIKGDKQDPFSKGYICPKATALQDIHEDPDRLKQPIKRTETGWEKISWSDAFDLAAEGLKATQQNHGKNSVGTYIGNPTAHNHGNILMLKGLLDAVGSKNRFSATSVDQLPLMLASMKLFGNNALFAVPDVDRARFLVILGANPLASGGSFMSGPNIKKRFSNLKRRKDGRIVTIDPRFTETAEVSTEHYYITPGKDAFLLLAMLNVIFSEGLENTAHLPVENINVLKGLCMSFQPEKVADEVGIKGPVIAELARSLATQKNAALYGRLGASAQEFGSLCNWLIYVINIVTGNMDVEGGMMFPRPAIDLAGLGALSGEVNSFDVRRSRVRNLPSHAGEFPAATMADEMLMEGAGQIKAMITMAGNPVLSIPNGRKMERALSGLDFMVSFDLYVNETTQYADLIIPPTSPLEHGHYDVAIQLVAYRHTAKYSEPLFEKPQGAYQEWQSILELTKRLNSTNKFTSAFAAMLAKYLYWLGDEGMLNFLLKMGPYARKPLMLEAINKNLSGISFLKIGQYYSVLNSKLISLLKRNDALNALIEIGPYGKSSFPVNGGLSIKTLKRSPHGIDIGPLKTCLPDRLNTQNKKINLDPTIYLKDINKIAAKLDVPGKIARHSVASRTKKGNSFDMLLIGRRHIRSNNSWLHNSHRLVKGKNRCTLLMNEKDAAKKKLIDGNQVEVSSKIGSVVIELEVCNSIKPGVVSIPHGWGHHREGAKLSIASKFSGVSVNDITDENLVESLTGVAILNGVPVKVASVKT